MPDASSIRLLIFDVDGVLTDGTIIVDDHGNVAKKFFVRDGFAIKAAMSVGLRIGVITGRSTRAVSLRMQELDVPYVLQGVRDKAVGLETLCQQAGIEPREAGYVGDELVDLPAMLRVGYAIAVADAADEVKAEAHYVTRAQGGRGAAREAIEHILKAQGKWDEVVEQYAL